jgi:hypothetical protein
MIGPVQLQDLSPRYEQAGYVEIGHFELWLGAGVDRLSTPR